MSEIEPIVLHRERDWIAVNKPSHVPTTAPPHARLSSLVEIVRSIVGAAAPYVHPLSRLDVDVTGVVLFALSERAVKAAQTARETGRYERRYAALSSPAPAEETGEWTGAIGVDPRDPQRRVVGGRDARQARSVFRVRARAGPIAWVEVDLATGRTHQIRVHAAEAGAPVVGDRTYGGARHLVLDDGTALSARRVMLHATRVVLPGGSGRIITAPVADDMVQLFAACGGSAPG